MKNQNIRNNMITKTRNLFALLFARRRNRQQFIPIDQKLEQMPAIALQSSSESKQNRVKRISKEWSEDAPFQCYSKIYKSSHTNIRLSWSIVLIILSFLTFWVVFRNIDEFLDRKLFSNIEYINEIRPEFPTVTICETNMFPTKYAENLIEKINNETYKLDLKNFAYTETTSESFERLMFLVRLNVTIRVLNQNFKESSELGLNLNKISRFSFDRNTTLSMHNYFRSTFGFDFGSCYQFNSGYLNNGTQVNISKVEVQGPMYGLKVFMSNLTYTNRLPTAESNGLKIFIHNKAFEPRPEEVIHIEKGKWTSISVTRTFTQKYPKPYSDCVNIADLRTENDSLIYKTLNISRGNYRQQDCFDLCLQRLIENKCKCSHPKFVIKINPTLGYCSSIKDVECILEQKDNSILIKDSNCLEDCPMECNYYSYEVQTSRSDYPTKEYFEFFKKSYQDYSTNKHNELGISIFYPYTKLTKVTQEPKINLIDLIPNIGGSMGIFLGFTIFSLIDIFVFFFNIVFSYLKN